MSEYVTTEDSILLRDKLHELVSDGGDFLESAREEQIADGYGSTADITVCRHGIDSEFGQIMVFGPDGALRADYQFSRDAGVENYEINKTLPVPEELRVDATTHITKQEISDAVVAFTEYVGKNLPKPVSNKELMIIAQIVSGQVAPHELVRLLDSDKAKATISINPSESEDVELFLTTFSSRVNTGRVTESTTFQKYRRLGEGLLVSAYASYAGLEESVDKVSRDSLTSGNIRLGYIESDGRPYRIGKCLTSLSLSASNSIRLQEFSSTLASGMMPEEDQDIYDQILDQITAKLTRKNLGLDGYHEVPERTKFLQILNELGGLFELDL